MRHELRFRTKTEAASALKPLIWDLLTRSMSTNANVEKIWEPLLLSIDGGDNYMRGLMERSAEWHTLHIRDVPSIVEAELDRVVDQLFNGIQG